MQKTQIIGNLGKDAEVKDFGNNQVINFSVAVTETWKKDGEKQSKTTWYECAKWGNNTAIAPYLTKGTQVYVEGKSDARAFVNNQGEAVAVNVINVLTVNLLGGNKNDGYQTKPKPKQQAPQPQAAVPGYGEQEDDLPF